MDTQWTFGTLNTKTGYMEIASTPIHRIIVTAFLGKAPTNKHIVYHIDENRQNNHIHNLRWITKNQKILLTNDITRALIIHTCGNIANFINNPSTFYNRNRQHTHSTQTSQPNLELENNQIALTTSEYQIDLINLPPIAVLMNVTSPMFKRRGK